MRRAPPIVAIVVGLTLIGVGSAAILDVGPFAPVRWVNRNGRIASLDRFEDLTTPFEHPGPEHCGWDEATFIALYGGQYVRDPGGAVAAQAHVTYDANAHLPADAIFTGWRKGNAELWREPSVADELSIPGVSGVPDVMYVVWSDHAELLPKFDLVCA